MARNLHTASTYQVHYTSTVIPGGDSQDIFDLIFMEFEISTNKNDEYDNEYDLYRSELVRLRDKIANQTDYYTEREEFLKEQLDKIGLSVEQFVEALNKLITTSDQSNENVLLSWY